MDDLDRMFRRLVQNIRTGYPDLLSRPFEVAELYQNIIPYRHNRSELGLEQNQDYEFALMRLLSGERGYLVVDEEIRNGMQRELASPSPDTGAFRAFSTAAVSLSSEAVRRLDQYLAGGARPDDARLGRTAPRAAGETASRIAPPPAPASPPPPIAPPAPPASFLSPLPPPPPVMPPPPPRSLEADAAAATMAMPGHRNAAAESRPQPRPQPRAEPRAESHAQPSGDLRDARQLSASSRQAPGGGGGASASAGAGAGSGGLTGQDERCHYCDGLLPAGRKVTFCPYCGQNLSVRHCPACSTELEVGWKFCIACGRSVQA
jgi:hypothetical protein